jgi:hypothetical protein
MPVYRAARWRKLPIPVLATWAHPYSFLGTPLIDPDRMGSTLRLLVEHGRRESTGLLALDRVGADGGMELAMTRNNPNGNAGMFHAVAVSCS